MNMRNDSTRRVPAAAVASTIFALALGGCSLDAENPAAITDPGLENPAAVTALVNGVIGDYDFAYQRSALFSGLLADEIRASGTGNTWKDADLNGVIQLDVPLDGLINISHHWWGPLQRARFLAEDTHARIQRVIPSPQTSPLTAMVRLYSGMAYRDIGEYFCRAAYNGGPAVERAQSLALAEQHLSEAITVATAAGADSIAQMAHLVRAQVRHSLGRGAEALADARAVPTGFRWVAHFRDGADESNDMVFQLNLRVEGTIQGPFQNTGDPRVPVVNTGRMGADNVTPRYDQMKLGRYANMPMGKWQEARLIEAELLLSQGDVAGAVGRMNEVRTAAGLTPLDTDLTDEEAFAALRRERMYELFLEGERMLDMRRWNEFPAGWQASCVPLPRSETDSNPNL